MGQMLPAGAGELEVETRGGRLYALHAHGPRPGGAPIVLIHGGGSDSSAISWNRLIEPLSQHREVWAFDLPGFGGSIDIDPVGGPDAMAHVLAEAMERVGATPALVAGVSMGGDVALNLTLDHPGHVIGLVLIAPGGLVPVFRNRGAHFLAWLATRAPDRLLLPAARFANRFVRAALRAVVKDADSLPPDVVEEFTRQARHPRGGMGYVRYNQATVGFRGMTNDLSERLSEISVPTLIFHGKDDPIVDPEGSRRAAAHIAAARLVMVPGCGHWAQLEAHELFLTEIEAFLSSVAPE